MFRNLQEEDYETCFVILGVRITAQGDGSVIFRAKITAQGDVFVIFGVKITDH